MNIHLNFTKKCCLSAALMFQVFTAYSQTGPGGVGSNSSFGLALWLQANVGVTSSGGNVSQWNDQSGNGKNVLQGTQANQPNIVSSVLNGFPVIRFTKANSDNLASATFTTLDRRNHTIFFVMSYDKANSDNDGGVIATSNTSSTGTIILKKNGNAFEYQGTASTKVTLKDPANFATHKIYVLQRDSTTSTFSTWRNGENTINALAIGVNTAYQFSMFKFGVNRGGTKFSSMDIAEAIVYYRKVNTAERVIIRNYLSSKYNLVLTLGDKYAGDTSTNGHYDYNVIGIGKESDGSQLLSSSSGLVLEQVSGFDNGDYLMAGHKTTTNATNNSDITGIGGTKTGRWERIWYFDKTDASTAMSVNIKFDFSDAGMGAATPTTASNYKLIYRAAQSGSWTVVATASSISGDQVIFSSQALSNGDGYYTLGSLDTTASPLPIELMFFKGVKVEEGALLNWQTASETNNDYFTILKSTDGKTWDEIGAINGVGTSVNINKYEFMDENLKTDSYYKLKQTDYDGQSSTSKAILVKSSQPVSYSITPSPNKGVFEIKGKVSNPDKITITDNAGKKVNFSFQVLEQSLRVSLDNPKPGMYLINIPSEAGSSTKLKIQVVVD